MRKLKKMGILGLVVKDLASVSQKTIEKSELPTGRSLEKGNMEVACKESGLTADAIFQDYLAEHFPCMTSEEEKKTEGALEYQLEYILGGKASDMENLKYVVNRCCLGGRYKFCFCTGRSNNAQAGGSFGSKSGGSDRRSYPGTCGYNGTSSGMGIREKACWMCGLCFPEGKWNW